MGLNSEELREYKNEYKKLILKIENDIKLLKEFKKKNPNKKRGISEIISEKNLLKLMLKTTIKTVIAGNDQDLDKLEKIVGEV